MKFVAALVTVVLVASASAAFAQNGTGRWGACTRFHSGHGDKADPENKVPFDGDWSYGLVYEYREPQAMFQIIMSGAPKSSYRGTFDGNTNAIDTVWTPEFNLVFTEGSWTGGMGFLKHLVKSEAGGQWSPIFWQVMTGVTLGQKAGFSLDLTACYEFRSLKTISNIDINDIDVRISVTKNF